jgi:hypothetical protein
MRQSKTTSKCVERMTTFPADHLVLVPNIAIGLFDDFDDDLGVPWAYPLDRLRRVGS